MENKKHQLPIALILISITMLLGFKNSGIFVKDIVNDDGTNVTFSIDENVNIMEENSNSFIILKNEDVYQIPKETIMKTKKASEYYRVIESIPLLDKPDGKIIRILQEDDILKLEEIDGEYGMFQTKDNYIGFVKLEALVEESIETLTIGISKVDKVVNNENEYYVLSRGENVYIKDFENGMYKIVDDNGSEFLVEEEFIDIRKNREIVSRSSLSRRTQSLNRIINSAYKELGKPYVYGDTGKKGYDCSGFTYSIFLNNLGIKLPRSSSDQVNAGTKVERRELIPGDLVFFNTTGRGISHVGLYIGDGNIIHASSGRIRKVIISTIDTGYYNQRYVTARRVIK